MRLRNREESDSGEQAVTVLEQLKQHILESALELERQRLEVYNSTAAKPTATAVAGNTAASQAGTAVSGNMSRAPSKHAPRQRLPPMDAQTSRTEKEERQLKKNSYPRSAKSPATNGAVEALLAANGLRVYGDVEGGGEGTTAGGSELLRGKNAATASGPAECSGYMQVGGSGYIGYETKHTRASVASREQQAASRGEL